MSDPVSDRIEHFSEPQRLAYLLRMVAINAYVAWSNTLIGNAPPAIHAQFERMKDPQVGDVVLETSTIWKASRYTNDTPSQFPGLGVLLRTADEPYPIDPDEYADDEPVPTEKVWYVRPLDGSVPEYRWTNASFIRVSVCLDDARPA